MNCIKCTNRFEYKRQLSTSCNYHSKLCQRCFINDLFSNKLNLTIKGNEIELKCPCNNNQTYFKYKLSQKIKLLDLCDFLNPLNCIYKDLNINSNCSVHNSKLKNIYCKNCKKYLCENCLFNSDNTHLGHTYLLKEDIIKAVKQNKEELTYKNYKDFIKFIENLENKMEKDINNKLNKEITELKKLVEKINSCFVKIITEAQEKIKKIKSFCQIIKISYETFYSDIEIIDNNNNKINYIDILREKEFEGIYLSTEKDNNLSQINEFITKYIDNITSLFNCDFSFKKKSYKDFIKTNYQEIKSIKSGENKNKDKEMYKIKNKLCGHSKAVFNVAKVNEETLVSCSEDTKIIIWDLKTYKPKNILTGHAGRVNHVIVSKKNHIISCSIDNTIKIWDIDTGTNISTIDAHRNNVTCVILIKENLLISSGWDAKIRVWDLMKNNKEILNFSTNVRTIGSLLALDEDTFCSAAFNNILIFSLHEKKIIKKLVGHSKGINCIIKNKNNKLLSGADDKTIRIWNLNKKICESVIEGHNDSVYCLLLLDNGDICSGAQDMTIRIRDCKTNKEKYVISEIYSPRTLLQLSDGSIVSAGFDNVIKIWSKNE